MTDMRRSPGREARNSLRQQLWSDPVFAHRWLCHPDRECHDGCEDRPIRDRLALYRSELEV